MAEKEMSKFLIFLGCFEIMFVVVGGMKQRPLQVLGQGSDGPEP